MSNPNETKETRERINAAMKWYYALDYIKKNPMVKDYYVSGTSLSWEAYILKRYENLEKK